MKSRTPQWEGRYPPNLPRSGREGYAGPTPRGRHPGTPRKATKVQCEGCARAAFSPFPPGEIDLTQVREWAVSLGWDTAVFDRLSEPAAPPPRSSHVPGPSRLGDEALRQLLEAGVLCPKRRSDKVVGWLPLFSVEKNCVEKGDKECVLRLIGDGREINERAEPPPPSLIPSVEEVAWGLFSRGERGPKWGAAVDFWGFFHQFGWEGAGLGVINKSAGCQGRGYFLYKKLPMGVAFAPSLAQCTASVIAGLAPARLPPPLFPTSPEAVGPPPLSYVCIDDVFITGELQEEVEAGVGRFKSRASAACALLKDEKEQVVSRTVEFLGVRWFLGQAVSEMKPKWTRAWMDETREVLSCTVCRVRRLWAVLGAQNWWIRCNQGVWHEWEHSFFFLCELGGKSEGDLVKVPAAVSEEWERWTSLLEKNARHHWILSPPLLPHKLVRTLFFPPPRFLLVADASLEGFGAMLFRLDNEVSGEYRRCEQFWGTWGGTHESGDMFPLEVLAACLGAERWVSVLCGESVWVVGDNVSALISLRKGRTQHRWAMAGLKRAWAALKGAERWDVRWIATHLMPADGLSRRGGWGWGKGGGETLRASDLHHPLEPRSDPL